MPKYEPPGAQGLMTMEQIGKLIGWRSRRVKRLLHRKGIGFKVGGRWYVTMGGIRAGLPQLYALVESEAARQSFDLGEHE